jgi:predicted nucleic acid-binding protein
MIVVSDTTPLITLLKVQHLELLKIYFGEVQIPKAVFDELTCDERFATEAEQIRDCSFIHVNELADDKSVNLLCRATGLDMGESEAIVLADEIKAELLLMDEAKGRDVAKQMGLKIMGTIGFLMASYQSGIISAEEIRKCIDIIRSSGRHIGEKYLQLLMDRISE